jgi:hypothetical protein
MQIEEIVSKVQNLREEHNREAQVEIINDLKKLRELILEEANAIPSGTGSADQKVIDKYEYRVNHLKKSFINLLENSEQEIIQLKKENEELKSQVNALKEQIKK